MALKTSLKSDGFLNKLIQDSRPALLQGLEWLIDEPNKHERSTERTAVDDLYSTNLPNELLPILLISACIRYDRHYTLPFVCEVAALSFGLHRLKILNSHFSRRDSALE